MANSFFFSSGIFSQSYLGLSKYLNSKIKLSLFITLGKTILSEGGWLFCALLSVVGFSVGLTGIIPANPLSKNSLRNSLIIFFISASGFSVSTIFLTISLNTKRISPNCPPRQFILSPFILNSSISIKGN